MIAITFALPNESQPLLRRFRHRGETGTPHASLGNLGLYECLLIHTGLGAERTRERLLAALSDPAVEPRPTLLISCGFAGALVPEIPAGQLFLAENATDPDLFPQVEAFLRDHDFPLATGNLYTAAETIELPEAKAKLARSTGAQAVDMETAVIKEVCEAEGIAMISLRAISDNATDPLPVPFSICIDPESGRARYLSIANHLALHPWRIPAFLQFAKRVTRSGDELARAVSSLLPYMQSL